MSVRGEFVKRAPSASRIKRTHLGCCAWALVVVGMTDFLVGNSRFCLGTLFWWIGSSCFDPSPNFVHPHTYSGPGLPFTPVGGAGDFSYSASRALPDAALNPRVARDCIGRLMPLIAVSIILFPIRLASKSEHPEGGPPPLEGGTPRRIDNALPNSSRQY